MLALTKEEAVRRHRELWNEIAELCTESHFSSCGFSVFKIKSMALNALWYDDPIEFQIACVGRVNMLSVMQYAFMELTKVYAASAP